MSIEPVDHTPAQYNHEDALLVQLNDALMLLDRHLPSLAGRPDVQASILLAMRDVTRNIGVVTDQLEAMLLAECPTRVNRAGREVPDRLVIDGVAVVEPIDRGGRWVDIDYPRMIRDVVRQAWDAGDIGHPQDVADLVCSVVTFSGIRSDTKKGTGLAAHGRDRADYATYKAGTPGVNVIPADGHLGAAHDIAPTATGEVTA